MYFIEIPSKENRFYAGTYIFNSNPNIINHATDTDLKHVLFG